MCTYRDYWLNSIAPSLEHLRGMASTLRGVAVGTVSASDEDLRTCLSSEQYTEEADARWAEADWFFGGYSVILSSFVETVMTQVLKDPGHESEEAYRWEDLKRAFKQASGVGIGEVPRYKDVLRIRRLANSFKHNNFRADPRLGRVSEYAEDQTIVFLLEDWDKLLNATEEFLKAAVHKLPQLE